MLKYFNLLSNIILKINIKMINDNCHKLIHIRSNLIHIREFMLIKLVWY